MKQWKGNWVVGQRPHNLRDAHTDDEIVEHIAAAERRIGQLEDALRWIARGEVDEGGCRRQHSQAMQIAKNALGE